MSIAMHREHRESASHDDRSATASDLAFGRQDPRPGAWRRTLALARRAYGPLLVYAALGIFLIVAVAIRVSIWAPAIWR